MIDLRLCQQKKLITCRAGPINLMAGNKNIKSGRNGKDEIRTLACRSVNNMH